MEYSLVKVSHVLKVKDVYDVNPIFSGVSIDSRTISPGNLFVAVHGKNFDGHDFIQEAKHKGATAVVVSRKVDVDIPQLLVKDTCQALGELAADYRKSAGIPVIAVTGSTGKTTTKNLIASILEETFGKHKTLSSLGGLNNEYGLPLTLTRLTGDHRCAVIEMGMNHPGELTYLSEIARPDVAVITNVAPCHLEGVGSVDDVAKAKAEIFKGLSLQGSVVLNRDDEYFQFWQSQLHGHRVTSFGFHARADVRAENITLSPAAAFTLVTPIGEIDIVLNLLGKHNITNALAAVAATLSLDIDLDTMKRGLEAAHATPGRMKAHTLASDLILLDDAYNANPKSVCAGIDTLALYQGDRILILGDMKELGEDEKRFHADVGHYAKSAGVTHLFALGDLTKSTCDAFGKKAWHFTSHEDLLYALQEHLTPGTTLLVKGSLSMRMQAIVSELLQQAAFEPAIL